jgi:MoaA/NifB/PqqE/SkfB family radical SAM enzyme
LSSSLIFQFSLVDFESMSGVFFSFFEENGDVEPLLKYARRRFPFLTRGFDEPAPFDSGKKYKYFAKSAADCKLLFSRLDSALAECSTEINRQRLLKNLYRYFDGIRPELLRIAPDILSATGGDCESIRQIMIFTTGFCNLSCPYCFSYKMPAMEMKLSDFESVLKWAKQNRIERVSFCGGEPTMHSRFDDMLGLCRQYGMNTYFASNFTRDCSHFRNFSGKLIDMIFVHLTPQTLEKPELMRIMHENIALAKKKKINLILRTNVSDASPEVDSWLKLCTETGLKELSVALAIPADEGKNRFIAPDTFQNYASMLKSLIIKAESQKIGIIFAKPLPLCIFDEETANSLLSKGNFPRCNLDEHNCTNNLSVKPDLSLNPCLGLTSHSLQFNENLSWNEVESFCLGEVKSLLSKPLFERCADCFLYDRKLCQGACLSYKIER